MVSCFMEIISYTNIICMILSTMTSLASLSYLVDQVYLCYLNYSPTW
jgi:hypothetical protein